MKVAAYQAPLFPAGSMQGIISIRHQIDRCESKGVEILCCPEAILGGLADYHPRPADIALNSRNGDLDKTLAPLASNTVTTIVGFTEIDEEGRFFNSAAVYHRGAVAGLCRKRYPAIRKSIYDAGDQIPVFRVGGLTFGIIICNDSNYPEPARILSGKGATALFFPTNNCLAPEKADVCRFTRDADIARAVENNLWVIRADVAGKCDGMVSYGSSEIIDRAGKVVQAAQQFSEDLIIAELDG